VRGSTAGVVSDGVPVGLFANVGVGVVMVVAVIETGSVGWVGLPVAVVVVAEAALFLY
jgi:hypothetical protein